MSFAERLSDLQKAKGVGRRDVFTSTGISQTAYHRYITGEREPNLSILVALANYFDVSIDYLAGRTDVPKMHSA